VCVYLRESTESRETKTLVKIFAAQQESHKSEDVNGRKPTVRRRNTKRNFRSAAAQEVAVNVDVAAAAIKEVTHLVTELVRSESEHQTQLRANLNCNMFDRACSVAGVVEVKLAAVKVRAKFVYVGSY